MEPASSGGTALAQAIQEAGGRWLDLWWKKRPKNGGEVVHYFGAYYAPNEPLIVLETRHLKCCKSATCSFEINPSALVARDV